MFAFLKHIRYVCIKSRHYKQKLSFFISTCLPIACCFRLVEIKPPKHTLFECTLSFASVDFNYKPESHFHQTSVLSHLYSKSFYTGGWSFIICLILYILKTWEQHTFFLAVDSIFWSKKKTIYMSIERVLNLSLNNVQIFVLEMYAD